MEIKSKSLLTKLPFQSYNIGIMKLVKARCPECGGILDIDGEKKAAICQYCKSPFIVEEAINNYVINNTVNNNTVNNITNVTNISGSNVVINQDELNRFWVIEGTTLVKYNGKQRNLKIPDNITEIATGAISGIEEVIIPSSITYIAPEAIKATKVILASNDKIVLGEQFMQGKRLEVLGAFGQFKKLTNTAEVNFNFTEEQVLQIQNDIFEKITYADITFFQEKIYIFKLGDSYDSFVKYTLNSKSEAIILDWHYRIYANIKSKIVDLTEIDGHKIVGFRNDSQTSLLSELNISLSNNYEVIKFPEGLKSLKYTPKQSGYYAKNFYLPKSLETIEDFMFFAWDNIYIPEGSKLQSISDKAFCSNVEWCLETKRYALNPIELPEIPAKIGKGAYSFLRYKGKYFGKSTKYAIETTTKHSVSIFAEDEAGSSYFSTPVNLVNGYAEVEIPEALTNVKVTLTNEKGLAVFENKISPMPVVNKIARLLLGYKLVQRNS